MENKTNKIEPIVKNACRCGLCGSSADRYATHFECTNPDCGACGDLFVGIFTQLDPEKIRKSFEK